MSEKSERHDGALPALPDTIETERLVLRRYEDEDAAAIARHLGDREMGWNLGRAPHPYRIEDAQAFLAKRDGAHSDTHAVTLRDGPLIGACGLTLRAWNGESGDRNRPITALGYWVGREHWGHGYASEAVATKLAEYFALGGDVVHARVFKDNERSLAVLEHAGFKIAGEATDRNLVREGAYPVWLTRCTPDDFRAASWNLDLATSDADG